MSKVVRLALFFLALWGVPALLCAQEGEPAARFLIEKITIEGLQRRSARAIVAAETRLREGETYTEAALRQAIYRVKRLPFVLDAEMSLRRGSERGAYELVVTVEPTRPVFFLAGIDGRVVPGRGGLSGGERLVYSSGATAGVRRFVGSHGLLFASVGKGEGTAPGYQLGYTHYDLAGSGGYASVGIDWTRDEDRDRGLVFAEGEAAEVELGYPVAADHSLRASVYWARSSQATLFDSIQFGVVEIRSRADGWGADLDWIYDTTDDPVFPSQGDTVTASIDYERGEIRHEAREGTEPQPLPSGFRESASDISWSLSTSGRRHFRLTPRQSVSFGAQASWQEESRDPSASFKGRLVSTAVNGSHSLSLWGFEKTERIGDLRLESGLFVGHSRVSASYPIDERGRTTAGLSTSVVFRNAWGVLRASLSYSEDDL
ncbi:MAG TPA: hypothetical protein VHN15_14000 [Thermoanaerobaculia bacterium]|nr:hypothetical protein [Thermoanaerobaculia bacterium]